MTLKEENSSKTPAFLDGRVSGIELLSFFDEITFQTLNTFAGGM